jgi:hypothetical protein
VRKPTACSPNPQPNFGIIGLGIPEYEAKRYEEKVRKGNILISVHTEDSDEVKRAKDIFEAAGAEDIHSTGEASVPKADKSTRTYGEPASK